MQLNWLNVADLIAQAGGDPWAVNRSLQVGNPFQISQLAEAFHAAGRCSTAAQEEFEQARKRFDTAGITKMAITRSTAPRKCSG